MGSKCSADLFFRPALHLIPRSRAAKRLQFCEQADICQVSGDHLPARRLEGVPILGDNCRDGDLQDENSEVHGTALTHA